MGKKTVGKKGKERVKHRDKELGSFEEVSDGKNEFPMSAEADAELHIEDEEKNEDEVSGHNVEFKGTRSEAVLEVGDNAYKKEKEKEKEKKKKKKKKKREISSDDVGLSANKKEGVVKDDVDVDKKKKKNKKGHEIDGNDVELNAYQIDATIESNVKDNRKKEKKKLQGGGGSDDIKFDASQSEAVMDSDLEVNKKKKSKRRHEVNSDNVEFGTSPGEVVIEGDAEVNNYENEKDKKKKKKKKKRKMEEVFKGLTIPDGEEGNQKKKKKQLKRDNEGGDVTVMSNVSDGEEKRETEQLNGTNLENIENSGKVKKRKNKNHNSSEVGDRKVPRTKKDILSESPKKVTFSDHVEVFPSSDDSTDAKDAKDDGLVRGKRFSKEEDEMIRKAVANYIESHRLGEEGLNMVLNCRSHKEVKNCWKEIGAALPWRPSESVYYRAHILFQRDENRKWSPEELEYVKKFHEKHGSNWKALADALGKHRFHVKDAWRRIRLPNMKTGQWSQEEYKKLFELVNMDLRMKASEEKKSKHGMLRDNISWEAISEKLETRTNAICCMKWYDQLTSPMVAKGKWSDTDDYHLVNALSSLDACCMDDVDWDNILENRSGSICRKRWNQMVKHLGSDRNKSFAEQVEILSTRYCPDVLEAREAYNSKTAVK